MGENDFAFIHGCGIVYDFNITLKSNIFNKYLTIGRYELM
jgi:hypothetical protein